jgi:thymidylate kinase
MKTEGPIICISGTDGTGKSTLVAALARALPGARAVSIWDMLAEPAIRNAFGSKAGLNAVLATLGPDARALFCATALQEALQRAGRGVRVVDSHWYKFMATELLLGADPALAGTMARIFPRPALTLHLALGPRVAAERKQGHYTAYECGLTQPTLEAFVQFQSRTVELVRRLTKDDGPRVVTLDAAQPALVLLRQARAAVRAALPELVEMTEGEPVGSAAQ